MRPSGSERGQSTHRLCKSGSAVDNGKAPGTGSSFRRLSTLAANFLESQLGPAPEEVNFLHSGSLLLRSAQEDLRIGETRPERTTGGMDEGALFRPSVPALLGSQSNGGPELAHPTAHWSQGEMSDPAPKASSGLQRGEGHPLSFTLRGRCGCSGFKVFSRELTCNEVASSLLRQTRKRCTLQKVNNSHTSDSGHALEALRGSFSCAVRRRAVIFASRARLLTRKEIVEGVSSSYMRSASRRKWSDP